MVVSQVELGIEPGSEDGREPGRVHLQYTGKSNHTAMVILSGSNPCRAATDSTILTCA